MPPLSIAAIAGLACMLSALATHHVSAQVPPSVALQHPRDSTATDENDPRVAGWVSLGLGGGTVSGLAAVARADVSVGRVPVSYRLGSIEPFFDSGAGVQDRAVLIGLRTTGLRFFQTASLGYARANPVRDPVPFNDSGKERTVSPSVAALAYDYTAHPAYSSPAGLRAVNDTDGAGVCTVTLAVAAA
jgi:hypothetical protein